MSTPSAAMRFMSLPRESYQPLPPPPPPPPPELPPPPPPLSEKPEPPELPGGVDAAAIVSPSDDTELVNWPTEKLEGPPSPPMYQLDTAWASAALPSAMAKRSAQVFSTSSATA